MALQRLRIRPLSPWRTPWQADTVAGLLCWTCVRTDGPEVARREIIEPMLAGEPPFVVSDAFPGDLLPMPATTRLRAWAPELRTRASRSAWLRPADFERARGGLPLDPAALDVEPPLAECVRQRNTLARTTDATSGAGGLFSVAESVLARGAESEGPPYLSVYVRVHDAFAQHFFDLIDELSCTGFGADTSTGSGQFEVLGEPESAAALEAPLHNANGVVALSTFQPAPGDPTDGAWQAFVKFGRLGPDLGVADVRKRPLVLFRPGACFRCDPQRQVLGRAIPAAEVLPEGTLRTLESQGIQLVHAAFGLAVPAVVNLEGDQ